MTPGTPEDEVEVTDAFEKELQGLINKHSLENESGTPDYVLAAYLRGCLTVWNSAVRKRDNWHSDGSC